MHHQNHVIHTASLVTGYILPITSFQAPLIKNPVAIIKGHKSKLGGAYPLLMETGMQEA